jgi:outer membrane biosynthesis protein TonB
MNQRPKHTLVVLGVLGVLLAGCQPDQQTNPPAVVSPNTDATSVAPTTTGASPTPTATVKNLVQTTPPTPSAKPKQATTRPKPKPTTKKPTTKPTSKPPSGQQGVHPGAFCTPEGATGYTSKGTKMRCTRKSGEDRARWRAA